MHGITVDNLANNKVEIRPGTTNFSDVADIMDFEDFGAFEAKFMGVAFGNVNREHFRVFNSE